MRAPWSGIFLLLFLQSCSQQPLSSSKPASTATGSYLNEISKFDNPDYVMQALSVVVRPGKPTRITPRFSNNDRSRQLAKEFNYFNGELDNIGSYEYNANILTRYVTYNSPGDDGIWQTADDIVSGYHDHAPAAANVISILYKGAGADQIWFNEDDEILYYYAPLLDADGNEVGTAAFTLAGDDNIWFTADDFVGWLTTENTVANETQWVMYLGAGVDNDWLTLDDNEIFRFALTTVDDAGVKQRHSYFQDAGVDGIPFTADDDMVYYHDYGYDTQGRIETNIMYYGPGNDGVWFNADDFVQSCKIQERDVNDLPVKTVTYRPGPDLSCFSDDDVIWGYHADSFDVDNLLTQSQSYYRPGADNTWYTPDDVLIYARIYQ